MKRSLFSLLGFLALTSFTAHAALIDFDSLPEDSVLTNQYAPVGVVFSGYEEGIAVSQPIATTQFSGQVGGAPVSGKWLLNLDANNSRADLIRMVFSGPVSGIKFDYIPFGSLGASTRLQAYNTGGTTIFDDVIGGTTVINSNIHYTGLIALSGVARLDILQPGDDEPWGMDNLRFDRASGAAPVPAPGSLGLLGVGLLGLARRRRRREPATR